MGITGTHALLFTTEAEALRAVFRDVFGWEHVDAGHGWLIFKLPPGEIGVHPSNAGETHHELCFMCDDVTATKAELEAKGIEFAGEPEERDFGITVTMRLPGGSEVLLYEPRHPTAI